MRCSQPNSHKGSKPTLSALHRDHSFGDPSKSFFCRAAITEAKNTRIIPSEPRNTAIKHRNTWPTYIYIQRGHNARFLLLDAILAHTNVKIVMLGIDAFPMQTPRGAFEMTQHQFSRTNPLVDCWVKEEMISWSLWVASWWEMVSAGRKW